VKWWIKALIASVVWIALCLGGAYIFFPTQTTPEQDARLSELLGEICGAGLVGVWLVVAWISGKIGKSKPKV
jgi:hypothetical protein